MRDINSNDNDGSNKNKPLIVQRSTASVIEKCSKRWGKQQNLRQG